MRTAKGFTLLELLVTIAVAAIVTALAIPSFRTIIVSNRLSSAANEYIAALTEAKLEAVRRNRAALFCGSSGNPSDTLGGACAGAGTVVTLTGSGTADIVRASPPTLSGISVGSTVQALRFSGQGQARVPTLTAPYAGLVADISSSQISSNNRRCIYMAAGSVISTCTVTNTTCPASEPTTCQ